MYFLFFSHVCVSETWTLVLFTVEAIIICYSNVGPLTKLVKRKVLMLDLFLDSLWVTLMALVIIQNVPFATESSVTKLQITKAMRMKEWQQNDISQLCYSWMLWFKLWFLHWMKNLLAISWDRNESAMAYNDVKVTQFFSTFEHPHKQDPDNDGRLYWFPLFTFSLAVSLFLGGMLL